jgi:uncharacterized protein (TIGR02611 family)
MIVKTARRPFLIRLLIGVVGAVILVAGLIGLALPIVPGWMLIFVGLAILAGEFVWARRVLDSSKARLHRLRTAGRDKTKVAA